MKSVELNPLIEILQPCVLSFKVIKQKMDDCACN